MVRSKSEGQPSAGDAFARRPLSNAQRHPDGQFHLRRCSEKRRNDRLGNSRGSRRAGTFYVSGGLVGTTKSPDWTAVDVEDIVALHRRGHEIGCHTFSHKRACDLDAESLAAEIERNRRYFRSLDPSIKVENFAYPFGYGAFVRKRQLATAFQSCRSIVPGVNSGTVDLQFLRAMPLIDRRMDRDGIERAFDEAQTNNGWLIFYSHDVADAPSPYGSSPALMNHALEAASRRQIPVLNMAEALLCAGA